MLSISVSSPFWVTWIKLLTPLVVFSKWPFRSMVTGLLTAIKAVISISPVKRMTAASEARASDRFFESATFKKVVSCKVLSFWIL